MSTTIVAVIINLVAQVLPLIGINIGGDQLTSTVQVLVAIGTGVWIWIRRVQQGDVNFAGVRKA